MELKLGKEEVFLKLNSRNKASITSSQALWRTHMKRSLEEYNDKSTSKWGTWRKKHIKRKTQWAWKEEEHIWRIKLLRKEELASFQDWSYLDATQDKNNPHEMAQQMKIQKSKSSQSFWWSNPLNIEDVEIWIQGIWRPKLEELKIKRSLKPKNPM